MKKIRAGIIGGGEIAECHIRDMCQSGKIVPFALCDVNRESLDKMGDAYGIPVERRYTSYEELLTQPEIDMVSICTPNVTHFEIAMAAVRNRKPYALEKPVSMSLQEAKALRDATVSIGLLNTVCFSYRYLPAVYKAKSIMQSGVLGNIHHVYAQYIEGKDDNENIPLLWRYQKELAGSGSLGDLGSHMLDMIHYLVGGFQQVAGCAGIIIPERKRLNGNGMGAVTTEDYFHAMATMEGGASATMAFTKFAWGRKNAHRLEIYGSKGGMIYTLEKGVDALSVCIGAEPGLAGDWEDIALECNVPSQMDSFGEILLNGENQTPATIAEGCYVQSVMEAMLQAADKRIWCDVSDFTK